MSINDDLIIITAEGNTSWTREHLSPSSWVRMFGENLIGDYGDKMQTLRWVDNRIAYWLSDLGRYVKEMENALAANRLPALAGLLGEINARLKKALEDGQAVENLVPSALHEFDQGSGFIPDDLKEKLAQAGWWDDKKREWVAKRFETVERQKRHMALRSLVDLTRQVVAEVQVEVKGLGKARASGQIGAYLNGLKNIAKLQKKFHSQFRPIYKKWLEPIIARMEAAKEVEKAEAEKIVTPTVEEKVEEQKMPVTIPQGPIDFMPKTQPMPQPTAGPGSPSQLPAKSHSGSSNSSQAVPSSEIPVSFGPPVSADPLGEQISGERPTMPSIVSPSPIIEVKKPEELAPSPVMEEPTPTAPHPAPAPKPKSITNKGKRKQKAASEEDSVDGLWLKLANQRFYQQLSEAASQNNPYLLGWMMVKHAEEIESVDENQAHQLFLAAEQLLNS